MRTTLHRKEPKQGHWEGAMPAFYPWKRVLIAIAIGFSIVLAVGVLAVVFADDAEAAPGSTCISRSQSRTATYLGVTVGHTYWYFNGCYWNDHAGVKSASLTVDGTANAPWEYRGTISSWTSGSTCGTWSNCTHNSNHLVIKGKRVKFEFCLPFVGCSTTHQIGREAVFDSYGNFSWRAA